MVDLSDEEAAARADGAAFARRFGALLRRRRTELGMNQSDLALATGVGRRFIIDLEAGKPSCHIGKALLVAETLGIRVVELLEAGQELSTSRSQTVAPDGIPSRSSARTPVVSVDDLPDLPDDIDEPGP